MNGKRTELVNPRTKVPVPIFEYVTKQGVEAGKLYFSESSQTMLIGYLESKIKDFQTELDVAEERPSSILKNRKAISLSGYQWTIPDEKILSEYRKKYKMSNQ